MKHVRSRALCGMFVGAAVLATPAFSEEVECGRDYDVVRGDTLSELSVRVYGSPVYQPIYNANVKTIGMDPDLIIIGQVFDIPCLSASSEITSVELTAAQTNFEDEIAGPADPLVLTFNRASAPPFVINTDIIDPYLAAITEVTEGRVVFVDPEETDRDHANQLDLVASGAVDGAYVLNSHLTASHPLLQLPMIPMFGGAAEQTAVSLWRLHQDYLAGADYFPEAELLGFVSAPAAHIWRDASEPITVGQDISRRNDYAVPYFNNLDTRGPAYVREEVSGWLSQNAGSSPTFFLAHGAALGIGFWTEGSNVSVMEVDNGLYTPTFSVILSNDAWAQISESDKAAIREISGEALAHRSAAWDAFDNAFRARMLEQGLKFEKADKALTDELWSSSLAELFTWMQAAGRLDIPAHEAVNAYLGHLRDLEDRLIYRSDETFVDQHPFVTSGL